MSNLTKINKTIRDIRKENRDEDIILRDQKKIIMNLKKLFVLLIIIAFSMKVKEIKTKFYQLKSDSHLPKQNCVICFIESPLPMMKNAFYFILKTLFVLKIFKFLS